MPGARAADGTTAEQTVAAMNTLWGSHAGYRANHAKGVVVEGSFTAAPDAATLSKASLFDGKPVPVTVRFSDSTGLPTLPDGSGPANPHGMSVKFKLADGGEMDLVTNSLKYFPVATGEEFLELLTAIARSGPDAAKPTPVERFMASHPSAPKAFATVQTPSSFSREAYHGIDAFVFVDAKGKKQPFRFHLVPPAGTEYLGADEAAKRAPNFLMEDISTVLGKAPVTFSLQAQLADPGDQTKDPSQPWPDDRKTVTMGTITLTKTVPDSDAAQKALLFMPGNLTDGIEVSDDPLIDARNQAYAVSFGKRSQ
ncbi:catalase family peroxidase [Methylobacterium sp. BTF04]|uniref:catalase family peroxidase n=1 Tax=Methylobacterium sp. BTF04 TaxID=2708300 RepID=UPI001FEF47A7|nr:catalase family peroxidase [Methylobacterium sp. BTF04]